MRLERVRNHMSTQKQLGDGDSSLVRILFRFVLNQALLAMSFVVPKRRGLVLFGAGLGKRFMGNPKYVYLRLLQKRACESSVPSELAFYWITEDEKLIGELRARQWPVIDKFSLNGFWKLLRAEFLVVESGMMATEVLHDVAYAWLFLGRFSVIQTWHGSPIKRICLDALHDRGNHTLIEKLFYLATRLEYQRFDCVIAQSQHDLKVLSSAFSNSRVWLFGSARNDAFYHEFEKVENLPARFNLKSYSRVLIYAPTYREAKSSVFGGSLFRHRDEPVVPFSETFLTDLNKTLASRNWLLLVKKHHLDKALTISGSATNIIDVGPVDDIQELLAVSDALITDYSSICFDFLQSGKPIIYYVYDLERYISETRNFYIEYSKEISGPFARTEQELLSYLLTLDEWFEDPKYQANLSDFRNRFQSHFDGRAADRLISYLVSRSNGVARADAAKNVLNASR